MPTPTPTPVLVNQWFQLSYQPSGSWKSYPLVTTTGLTFSDPSNVNSRYQIVQYEVGAQQDQYEVLAPTNSNVLIEWTSGSITYKQQTNTGSYGYTNSNSPDLVTLI